MVREIKTIREAAEEWVREMNAIPQGMIAKLMAANPDEWREITMPTIGDRVYVWGKGEGEISGIDDVDGYVTYTVAMDNGDLAACHDGDMDVERDDLLPMWGTMWSFGDSCDDGWLEIDDGIALMSRCGFRVYESEEFGYFFGIDGAGYSFYDEHWIPLYKARGLKWHDPATEHTV